MNYLKSYESFLGSTSKEDSVVVEEEKVENIETVDTTTEDTKNEKDSE